MNAHNTNSILNDSSVNADLRFLNTLPLLHEIAHALRRLQRDGITKTLDLNAIPFGPGDEQDLLGFLGRGEVSVKLEAMGESHIWESAYPGVWILDHKGRNGERIAFQIEITKLPRILESQPEDIGAGMAKLQEALTELQAAEPR